MKDADLIQALKRIKVQTGGLICLGCGHEHNCGVHGCAVIREAAQRLEEYHQGKEHIDPEALHGSWEGTADGYSAGELVYDVWRCGDCGHVEETDDPDLLPRFCPSCGRAMTPEAEAELEKRLRGCRE